VSWLVVLLGATFAAALSVFHYQQASMRLPKGYELYGVLRLLGRFADARTRGRGLHSAELLDLEQILTDDLLQSMLHALCGIALLSRTESGEWLLARDLDEVGIDELYEAASLRIPVADATLPCIDDALGVRVRETIEALREPLCERMQRSVGSIYLPPAETSE
jgi:membrane protein